jgi:hypothetical protein
MVVDFGTLLTCQIWSEFQKITSWENFCIWVQALKLHVKHVCDKTKLHFPKHHFSTLYVCFVWMYLLVLLFLAVYRFEI